MALIVTIIIMLILAGVTIQQLTGNGLITKAQQAALESRYANAAEKVALAVNASYDVTGSLNDNYLKENLNKIDGINKPVDTVEYDLKVVVDGFEFTISEFGVITGKKDFVIADEELPENTPENPQETGKEVALKDGWGMQHVTYVKTSDGTEVKTLETLATVYAVSVGNGETVPIPGNGKTEGFYYVGGTISTGVIISDNSADKYDGKVDKTTYEYAPNLKGNQFVWIPCTIDSYKKTTTFTKVTSDLTWGTKSQNGYYDTSTNSAEKTQIEKYGGFYVGRYEAGTSNIKGVNFSSIITTGLTTDDTNYTNVTSGNVTSKANEIPYYHADYKTAVEMSERMYKSDTERKKYVNSGLVTGTMWDVMIKLMNEKTSCNLSSSGDWGNYYDKEWKISRGSYCEVNSSGGHSSWATVSSDSGYKKEKSSRVILSTASNNSFDKYHLYDVAGNLWEWTQEMAFNSNTNERFMVRGASFYNLYDSYPASFRGTSAATTTNANNGFRVALYMK